MATEGATAGAHGPANASEYIVHHLGHLNTSGHPQKAIIDFSIVNLDTVFWSIMMALLTGFLLHRAAKQITSDVPGRFVGAIESVVEFVHEQARYDRPRQRVVHRTAGIDVLSCGSSS